jgi:hypothetical protein
LRSPARNCPVIEVGQLRMWKKKPDGGQFYVYPDGMLLFVLQCYDNGKDEFGRQRPLVYTVMLDNNEVGGPQTPWFYDQELEQHTVLVEP